MAPPKKTASPELALYDRLIATIPSIERKGAANPYTSLNGNMFTLLHQSRLAIRLPEDRREEFLRKYKTTLFEAYGTVMQEYVAVPATLLRKRKRTEEVSRAQLRIRQDAKDQTKQEEIVRVARALLSVAFDVGFVGVVRALLPQALDPAQPSPGARFLCP